MDALRKAAEQALEALERHGAHDGNCDYMILLTSLPPMRKPCSCGLHASITTLRTALAQQEQEPVAWLQKNGFRFIADIEPQDDSELPLYTRPPRREWQGLTDKQIKTALAQVAESIDASSITMTHWPLVARAIEAKLKERNHG